MNCVIDKLPDNDIDSLYNTAKDLAISNGLVMYTPDYQTTGTVACAPITLFPSPLPNIFYKQAIDVQKDFNLLFHRVASDEKFLHRCLEKAVKVDDFLAKLWDIYLKIKAEGLTQKVFLGLNRSDYMIDTSKCSSSSNLENAQLKQVEFNLMASSFGGLSKKLTEHHRTLLSITGLLEQDSKKVLDNNCASGLALGLVQAWQYYGIPSSCILFVVHDHERNVFDQRELEFSVYRLQSVKVLRKSFTQLQKEASLTADGKLLVGGIEVGVIYFRDGYVPEHLPDDDSWLTKLLLERSKAIKCPCIAYMLANTKLVQQALLEPGAVEQYLDADAVDRVRATFAGQWLLDDQKIVEEALQNPSGFVLKPQREGGGNNFYDSGMVDKLKEIVGTSDSDGYILMQRFRPFSFQNYILRANAPPQLLTMCSELGIYGVFLGDADGDKIHANSVCGHLLRSKGEAVDEGGVAAGFAALDTPHIF